MTQLNDSKGTILVVDDEPGILTLIRSLLEGEGFTVLAANSADEAGTIAESFSETIHLLVSDVAMPDGFGPDLATRLQQRRPEMSIILMSGHSDHSVLGNNQSWQFLKKPFLGPVLVGLVNQAVGQS